MRYIASRREVCVAAGGICLSLAVAASEIVGACNPGAAADEPGIEKLHQQDITATLSGDFQALANLFTEEGVLLQPDSPAIVGRVAILAESQGQKTRYLTLHVVSYKPTIKELKAVGELRVGLL